MQVGRICRGTEVQQALRVKPTNPIAQEAAYHLRPLYPPTPAARGAGPGHRHQPESHGSARSLRREGRKGGLPRMPLESRSLDPPSPAHHSGPARLRPESSGTDLKVPLSSRSSGGAAARCLLWDMLKRDGPTAGGRVVRSDVLAPRVGWSPRGALQCRRHLLLPSSDSPSAPPLRLPLSSLDW